VSAGVAAGAGAPAPSDPCYGAGAQDPSRKCDPVALRLTVVPTPAQVVKDPPAAPCAVVERSAELFACGWGAPRAIASRTVALLGDSHATHWRPALENVARRQNWRVVSMSRAGCPITTAVPRLVTRARSLDCMRWNRAVQRWLRRHKEIKVVFVGQHRGKVNHRPGQSWQAVARRGYLNAWRQLLRHHVKHVVVLRDTPRDTPDTQACVARALSAGTPAGPACAVPRAYAVRSDPAADAARRAGDTRIGVVDLTRLFCSARLCLPVLGGALVHRDTEHMTRQFAASLAPFLLRTVRHLALGWRVPVQRLDNMRGDGRALGPQHHSPLTPAAGSRTPSPGRPPPAR
jgi:hypothetical protein